MLECSGENIRNETIGHYCDALGSKLPTPGGGGASAVAGAFGCSLGLMVISFTLGKKRYADVEEDLKNDQKQLLLLREDFYRLAEEDEKVFAPLARTYKLPENTEEEKAIKAEAMEKALYEAAEVPLETMKKALEALKIVEDVAEKGSRMAISDAGVAGDYLTAALKGSSLNVLINARSMQDLERREAYIGKCGNYLDEGAPVQSRIASKVLKRI